MEAYAAGRVTVSWKEIVDMAALHVIVDSLPTGNWEKLVEQTVPRPFFDLRRRSEWVDSVSSRYIELSYLTPEEANLERLKIIHSNKHECSVRYPAIEHPLFGNGSKTKTLVGVNENGVHFFEDATNIRTHTAHLDKVVKCERTSEGVILTLAVFPGLQYTYTVEVKEGEDLCHVISAYKADAVGGKASCHCCCSCKGAESQQVE